MLKSPILLSVLDIRDCEGKGDGMSCVARLSIKGCLGLLGLKVAPVLSPQPESVTRVEFATNRKRDVYNHEKI